MFSFPYRDKTVTTFWMKTYLSHNGHQCSLQHMNRCSYSRDQYMFLHSCKESCYIHWCLKTQKEWCNLYSWFLVSRKFLLEEISTVNNTKHSPIDLHYIAYLFRIWFRYSLQHRNMCIRSRDQYMIHCFGKESCCIH